MGLLPIRLTVAFYLISIFGLSLTQSKGFKKRVNAIDRATVAITQNIEVSVPEIARQVTVRIMNDPAPGSGVIIQRQGQIYTVLTNKHVVVDSEDRHYQILTCDGEMHQAKWLKFPSFEDIDLALIEFKSSKSYTVVTMGNSEQLTVGDTVYASGFPNWNWIDRTTPESTLQWKQKAFKLTEGKVGMILEERSLKQGYQLGYTNEIEVGMSGGPILDSQGYLIGLNGRVKYPFGGINDFIFTDGTQPFVELFLQMETLSWGIPVKTYQRLNKSTDRK